MKGNGLENARWANNAYHEEEGRRLTISRLWSTVETSPVFQRSPLQLIWIVHPPDSQNKIILSYKKYHKKNQIKLKLIKKTYILKLFNFYISSFDIFFWDGWLIILFVIIINWCHVIKHYAKILIPIPFANLVRFTIRLGYFCHPGSFG